MQGGYEDNEIDGNEEMQTDEDQEEVLNIDNVDLYIDKLDDYVAESITQKGFYAVDLVDVENVDSDGNELFSDENEEHKRQRVRRIGIEELFDLSGDEPVISEKFKDKNIIYCNGKDEIYYGDLGVKGYKDENGEQQIVVFADGKGREYKNKECVFAGFFKDGKKTKGVVCRNSYKFLKDCKGNSSYEKYGAEHLFVSFDSDDIDKRRQKSDFNKYENAIIFPSKGGENPIAKSDRFNVEAKVKNIKIQINNGYKFDFSKDRKDFLNEKGELVPFSDKEGENMCIDVDAISNNIKKIINKYKGSLKTVEIAGMNNFGVLHDKEKRELIGKIFEKCKDVVVKNNINVFFSNIGKNDIVTEVEERYKGGETSLTIVSNGQKIYGKLNFLGENITPLSEEEYKKQLSELGYYSNVIKSVKKENVEDSSCLFFDSEKDRDVITDLQEKTRKKNDEEIRELRKKRKKIKNDELEPLEMKKPEKVTLDGKQWAAVVVAFFVLPIVGSFILYEFFRLKKTTGNTQEQEEEKSSPIDDKTTDDKKETPSKEDEEKKDEEEKKQEEGLREQRNQQEKNDFYKSKEEKISSERPELSLKEKNALKEKELN